MRATVLCAMPLIACGATTHDPAGAGGEAGGTATCVGAHWQHIPPPPAPVTRIFHGAAASTDEVVIWGGGLHNDRLDTGYRIRSDGSLLPTPMAGAPSGRRPGAAGMLGSTFVIWGGSTTTQTVGDGKKLNLGAVAWDPISVTGAPTPRSSPWSAELANGLAVVGGGDPEGLVSDGGVYRPAMDTWTKLPDLPEKMQGAAFCAILDGFSSVGDGLVIHGGYESGSGYIDHGYVYSVLFPKWEPLPAAGAPSARAGHTIVLSTSTNEVVVWGGAGPLGRLNDGARLSLMDWKWQPLSTVGAPSARAYHRAVMLVLPSGSKMVVFGGTGPGEQTVNDGGVYDLSTDTWQPLPMDECAPPPFLAGFTFTAFGSGKKALVWGGHDPNSEPWPGEWPEQGWILSLSPDH